MLGIIGSKGMSSDYLMSFRRMAEEGCVKKGVESGHKDGWGIVCYADGMPNYLGRRPEPANEDREYEVACHKLDSLTPPTKVLIAHVRKASKGNAAIVNTHPFTFGNWSFAHNGTIYDYERLPVKLPLEGDTDSERFFKHIVAENRTVDAIEAIRRVVEFIRKQRLRYSSLTFLMSNGIRLYAFRSFTDSGYYYTLYFASREGAAFFSSERLWPDNWVEVKNGILYMVDRSLNVEQIRI